MRDGKTTLMRLKEMQFGHPIETLIKGPLSEVAKKLRVDKSTIVQWRVQLDIKPPGWCGRHGHRIDDFCGDCWIEHLQEPREVKLSQD